MMSRDSLKGNVPKYLKIRVLWFVVHVFYFWWPLYAIIHLNFDRIHFSTFTCSLALGKGPIILLTYMSE